MARPPVARVNGAGAINIECKQGQTFSLLVTYTDSEGNPVDLTGQDIRAQVRKTPRAAGFVLGFTTENSESDGVWIQIVGDPTDGQFRMRATAAAMRLVPARVYVWDLEIGDSDPLLEGDFEVTPEVTRG